MPEIVFKGKEYVYNHHLLQTTVTLRAVFCGTVFNAVQEGIPAVIPPEACYLGWQESLALLVQLTEADIRES